MVWYGRVHNITGSQSDESDAHDHANHSERLVQHEPANQPQDTGSNDRYYECTYFRVHFSTFLIKFTPYRLPPRGMIAECGELLKGAVSY